MRMRLARPTLEAVTSAEQLPAAKPTQVQAVGGSTEREPVAGGTRRSRRR